MRRARRGVVALLLLAALGAAEAGARLVAARSWRPLPPFGHAAVQRDWLERSERELAEGRPPPGYSRFDAQLGWNTAPGFVSGDGRVHVNARGLRSLREYDELPAPGVERVLVCGESFTFGEEVADAEAWPARLEAAAPAREVLNYGVGGYGTDQALLRVTREARGPHAALLVGLLLENIGRNVNRYRPLWYPLSQPAAKPRYLLTSGGLELLPQPYATRADFVAAVRSGAVFAELGAHEHWSAGALPAWLEFSTLARLLAARRAYAARELAPLWADSAGEPFLTTLSLLEAFRPVARSLGTERLIVLVFPARTDLAAHLDTGRRYWSTLLAALDARRIEWLDLTEPLAAHARAHDGPAPLYLEGHFSPLGNELVAAAVAARLAQAGPPPQPK